MLLPHHRRDPCPDLARQPRLGQSHVFERLLSESLTEIQLEPRGASSTEVELTARMRLRGFARFGSFQFRRATGRQLQGALERLESTLVQREA